MGFLKYIHLLLSGVWIGGIIFFSFILTPTLFKQLPKEVTSKVLDVIFPKYYLFGMICAVVVLVTHFFSGVRVGWSTLLLAVMLGSTFYAGFSLYPEAHRLKIEMKSAAEPESVSGEVKARFQKTHRWAVLLNMLVLILGFVYIYFISKYFGPSPL